MTLIPYLVFALVALAAIAFIAGPVARSAAPKKARLLLGAAAALFLLGVGGGTYLILGRPALALRSGQPDRNDVNGLVNMLVERVKKTPQDDVAWGYLGRGYLAARDPQDAARAFARAITVQKARGQVDGGLYSAYGESLVERDGGQVSPEAQSAFNAALATNPRDFAARFFLGQAQAMKGDREGARRMWSSLLAETPTDSPLHQILVDRVALLTGAAGGSPDISAMVAGLAARLKNNPDDAAGWQRLIRAYSVLGDSEKAKAALATARKTFAARPDALAPINAEAKDLKIE